MFFEELNFGNVWNCHKGKAWGNSFENCWVDVYLFLVVQYFEWWSLYIFWVGLSSFLIHDNLILYDLQKWFWLILDTSQFLLLVLFFLLIGLLLPDQLLVKPWTVNFWDNIFLLWLFEYIPHHLIFKCNCFLFKVIQHDTIRHVLKRLIPLFFELCSFLKSIQNVRCKIVIYL